MVGLVSLSASSLVTMVSISFLTCESCGGLALSYFLPGEDGLFHTCEYLGGLAFLPAFLPGEDGLHQCCGSVDLIY